MHLRTQKELNSNKKVLMKEANFKISVQENCIIVSLKVDDGEKFSMTFAENNKAFLKDDSAIMEMTPFYVQAVIETCDIERVIINGTGENEPKGFLNLSEKPQKSSKRVFNTSPKFRGFNNETN